MNSLDIRALALSLGITWGLACLLLGWTASFEWGDYFVDVMSSFYLGYKPGFMGGIVGGVWGFLDGAIGGAVFAYIYNHLLKKGHKKR